MKLFFICSIHAVANPCKNSELPKGKHCCVSTQFQEWFSHRAKKRNFTRRTRIHRSPISEQGWYNVIGCKEQQGIGHLHCWRCWCLWPLKLWYGWSGGRLCICYISAYICNMGFSWSLGASLLFHFWLQFLVAKVRSEESVSSLPESWSSQFIPLWRSFRKL